MQAAKIKIGDIYAIRDDHNNLVMFRPHAVNTRRTGPHPSDFVHKVEGFILNDDLTRRGDINDPLVLGPNAILGPYEEQAELVARKAASDAEAKRIKEAKTVLQLELIGELRRIAKLPPLDPNNRNEIIRADYGHGIEIKFEAVEALLAALRRPALKVVS